MLTDFLETLAPAAYQESYDNAGLLVGDPDTEVQGVLVSLDCTEAVVAEALRLGCNVVVAHHPIVFRGLRKLTGKTYVERTVMQAICGGVALFAIHTNLDHVWGGVNFKIAEKLGLEAVSILSPKKQILSKLTAFVPLPDTERVLAALHGAGAGHIGQYSHCSFRSEGTGTFRPSAAARPHIGQAGVQEQVQENRIEVIFPTHLQAAVLAALRAAHPYEEVAYYLHLLENENQQVGAGAIGTLPRPLTPEEFLAFLKKSMHLNLIRYTETSRQAISRVAVCGGAGSFLLPEALRQQADAFVTADFKYHEFFDAEGRLMVCDIGHYESEVYTKDLLAAAIREKFTNFATILSEINTNPVQYFA